MPHLIGLELHTDGISVAALRPDQTIVLRPVNDMTGILQRTSPLRWKWSLGTEERDAGAVAVASEIFQALQHAMGDDHVLAAVAIPSVWADRARRSLLRAMEGTSIEAMRLVRDTTALALGASLVDPTVNGLCAIIDLGVHKLEVAIADVAPGAVRVRARRGVVGLDSSNVKPEGILPLVMEVARYVAHEAGVAPTDLRRVVTCGRRLAARELADGLGAIWGIAADVFPCGTIALGAAGVAVSLTGMIPAWTLIDDLDEPPLSALRGSARRQTALTPAPVEAPAPAPPAVEPEPAPAPTDAPKREVIPLDKDALPVETYRTPEAQRASSLALPRVPPPATAPTPQRAVVSSASGSVPRSLVPRAPRPSAGEAAHAPDAPAAEAAAPSTEPLAPVLPEPTPAPRARMTPTPGAITMDVSPSLTPVPAPMDVAPSLTPEPAPMDVAPSLAPESVPMDVAPSLTPPPGPPSDLPPPFDPTPSRSPSSSQDLVAVDTGRISELPYAPPTSAHVVEPHSGPFVGLPRLDSIVGLDLVHPSDNAGLSRPSIATLLNQFTFLRGTSGTLTLRSRNEEISLPIDRGGVCLTAAERGRTLRIFDWPDGAYTWRREKHPWAIQKQRFPMTAYIVAGLRIRLRNFDDPQFTQLHQPKMRLSPTVIDDRRGRLERLALPEAEHRAVEYVVDGTRSFEKMLGEGYIGRTTFQRLVLLLDLYGILQWAQPTLSDHEDPIAAMTKLYSKIERANHFVAMGIHWSAPPVEILGAWEKAQEMYGPGGTMEKYEPMIAARILRRISGAWQILRVDALRVAHRREAYPGMDEDLLAPLVEARAKALAMRGEKSEAEVMMRLHGEFNVTSIPEEPAKPKR